jgi:UDP-N-acetylmuramate: L-alanyl-gamma-D-glutamyl-meso-diaminopimelate ligase
MKTLYFIGIAGTAMGNLAIALSQRGFSIAGSDSGIYPPMSTMLEDHAISIFHGFSEEHIRATNPDLVIIGNAMSRGNVEVEYVLNHRLPYASMSEIIHDEIIGNNTAIVITGTHGKTTTTSMTSKIFDFAGKQPGFVIGAKPGNFPYGCRPIPTELFESGKGICIIEGDEYDTAFWDKRSKFFHYPPNIAVINAIEFDHGDIFESLNDILNSFKLFLRLIPSSGILILNADDTNAIAMMKYAFSQVETFSMKNAGNWNAHIINVSDGQTTFSCSYNGISLGDFTIPMIGEHNVRNAMASMACAYHSAISIEDIRGGLRAFIPPKRRLEIIGNWKDRIIIDDFAHHPTAIKETIKALKYAYPVQNIHAIFEPRSNTTTRNIFQKELGECFGGVNSIVLGPINRPERFTKDERLDVDQFIADYAMQDIPVLAIREESSDWGINTMEFLEENTQPGDLIILMSNGNIGTLRTLLT